MKRFFHSLQIRTNLILVLCITLSFFSFWFSMRYLSDGITKSQREEKLFFAAGMLDFALGDRTYDSILYEYDMQDASKEAQIALLNRVLAKSCDEIAALHPGLGIGYYSRKLDAILTYAPSAEYGSSVGASLAENHPGRLVMLNNEKMVRVGTMVRGNIMNAMHPIVRHGAVIGYAWANELSAQINSQFLAFSNQVLLFMGFFYIFALFVAVALSQRSLRSLTNIIAGVSTLRSDLSYRLPTGEGELGDLTDSINAMAEDIAKAQEERKALLLAEAANVAQRDFIARMSHELRTPMNGVLGMTQLAQTAPTEEARLNYLSKIHSSASILLGIINDILDFSKIEAGKMTLDIHPFSLPEMVLTIQDLIAPRLEAKNLSLVVSIDKSIPQMAEGDGLRLSQILLNLLGNAAKFTLEGSVTLSLRASLLEDDRLRLYGEVRDTGIGMDAQQLASVFSPFVQADSSTARRFGGTGLGLSITKAMIDLMNGEISVESEIGKGSAFSFFVELSQYHGEPPAAFTEQKIYLNQRYDGYHSLVVEDNEINQEIAKAFLTDMGFTVEIAGNGEEAITAFTQHAYDLIFMDIRMPVMDGLTATRKIRSLEKKMSKAKGVSLRIPIVAMTANAMQEDRKASQVAGMDSHISKPIDMNEVRQVLYSLLIAKE